MSSAVISTSAATGRPFVFDEEAEMEVCSFSNVNHGRRASLDRTAPFDSSAAADSLRAGLGDCPHMSLLGKQESAIAHVFQSTIKNQPSTIPSIGNWQSQIGNSLPLAPASRLAIRPSPEMVPSGIPALDALTGGLPRGCLTEICGPASSGRSTVLLAALAAATHRGEFCALVDASDALDPQSAAAASVELDRLLWVRCGEDPPRRHPSTSLRAGPDMEKTVARNRSQSGCSISAAPFAAEVGSSSQIAFNFDGTKSRASEPRLEQVLRATDLLLESGGFGLIALDFADLPPQAARRIPLTTWFRFRRAIEHKPTILLAIEPQPITGSCSSLLLQLGVPSTQYSVPGSNPTHAQLLAESQIRAELLCSRLERKPARSITFAAKTAWAG